MTRLLGQIVILFLMVIALVGCAPRYKAPPKPPTAQELQFGKNADKPASEEVANQAVITFFARDLKDPYSARYGFLELRNSYHIGRGYRKFGWFMCGKVNARNSYGAYSGTKTFMAYFDPQNGSKVLDGLIENAEEYIVSGWCYKIYKGSFKSTNK